MRTRVGVALMAAALALGASAGCGRGASKSDFVKQADERCRLPESALGAVASPSDYPSTADAAAALLRANEAEVAALRQLEPPDGDESTVQLLVDELVAVSAAARTLEGSARAGALTAGPAAAELQARAEAAARSARAYGLAVCGSGVARAASAVVTGVTPVLDQSFAEAIDSACLRFHQSVGRARVPSARGLDPVIARSYDEYLRVLKATPAPPGKAESLADLISAVERELGAVRTQDDALRRGDSGAVTAAREDLRQAHEEANARRRDLGGRC